MGTHIPDSLPAFAKKYEDRHFLSSTTQSPSCSNLDGDEVLTKPSYYTSPVMRKELSSFIQGRYSWYANSQRPFDGREDAEQYASSTSRRWDPNTPPVSIAEFENCPYNYTDYEAMSTNYTSSPVVVSPRGWSAASDQSDWNSPIEQSRHQALSNDGRPLHSPLSCDLAEISDVNIALNYPRYYHEFESEPPDLIRKPHPAPMLSDTPPHSSIPGADVNPSNIFSSMRDQSCAKEGSEFIIPGQAPSATANSRAMDTSKNGEPYARLIYRAFMSVPSHAMTLQEIYEWFRVNTDKANSPGKDGWKNSIRHNLSMNHAFVRREKIQDTELGAGGPLPIPQPAGDARKSTEWVLEDWALRDGVQSTTRYRPKGSHSLKRGRHSSLSHNVTYHANPKHPHLIRPGRAVSGEKGGFATSRGRRKARYEAPPTSAGVISQQMNMLDLQMGTNSGQAPYQFSQHHQHQQLPLACEQVVMYEQAYSNQPPPHGEAGLASPLDPERVPAGLDFGLSGPNTGASVSSLQQPDVYDFPQYSLSDVECVYPAGRFAEGGNMLHIWGQGSYQTPGGNGSPATP
ncbi:forkhead domain-containing protein [Verticillium alfalfae VaMs.102]|uniref:Forkhead domain-containing protein n=1 Tax=Verticillium alfalfae (strain VaMs.102 / ATCC MYA-4576 / FGSC 10136) TaxID=526221 RepID=C9SYK0_VERA1|nr:forkhead domain-containing protein [Verticillium alfalfae VaMs.102]EEY23865.1 forkhead domain-containing protein [Verticillium alfalfae VaMs.102]